jgi:formate dehydrogenase iron-sulfur subunit
MTVTGFFTDSTLCIGCKACEVACKEWNDVPEDGLHWSGFSYDNTLSLGHSTWRHVKFVEEPVVPGRGGNAPEGRTWSFSSDVCKHCETAGCLEACPTGSIVRTEFGSVFVQPDICNGCGYCVVSCPFGVVDRRPDDGRAFKCTFCYDRQKAGLVPACAKACPTESIQFGPLDELRDRARGRVAQLHAAGMTDANVYDPVDTSVGGTHAFFLVRGDARSYNLPPKPESPTSLLGAAWTSAAKAAGAIAVASLVAFALFGGEAGASPARRNRRKRGTADSPARRSPPPARPHKTPSSQGNE